MKITTRVIIIFTMLTVLLSLHSRESSVQVEVCGAPPLLITPNAPVAIATFDPDVRAIPMYK